MSTSTYTPGCCLHELPKQSWPGSSSEKQPSNLKIHRTRPAPQGAPRHPLVQPHLPFPHRNQHPCDSPEALSSPELATPTSEQSAVTDPN